MLCSFPDAGPAADRRGTELDVRGLEDLGRLGQGDPVGRGAGHQSASPLGLAGVVAWPGPDAPPFPPSGSRHRRSSRSSSVGPLAVPRRRAVVPGRGRAVAGGRLRRRPCVDAAAPRSFFAQPEPLKWTAGATNALRIGPPPHTRACLRTLAVDAVDDLHPMAAHGADIVVDGHRGPAFGAVSRGAGACRTSGSRTPARGPRRTRSARRRGRRDRPPGPGARSG